MIPASLTVLALVLAHTARADDPLFPDEPPKQSSVRTMGSFGLGLGAGTSTAGLSMKYFARETLALQGVVGAGYDSTTQGSWSTGLGAGADLLFEMPSFASLDDVEFGWSAGPGIGVSVTDNGPSLAVAGVVGLELGLLQVPMDIVLEYRPRMLLAPELGWDWFSLSGHIRWYFKRKHA